MLGLKADGPGHGPTVAVQHQEGDALYSGVVGEVRLGVGRIRSGSYSLLCWREIVIVITIDPRRGIMTDLCMAAVPVQVGDRQRYDALMDVVANRITTRAFQPDYVVPREHFELIVDAARHGPSGANAQPWHYIVVTDPDVKRQISEYFVAEQGRRARLGMKFPTPNYHGIATAPGLVVVATDFRFIRAFPVLREDDQTRRSTAPTTRMPSGSCCRALRRQRCLRT